MAEGAAGPAALMELAVGRDEGTGAESAGAGACEACAPWAVAAGPSVIDPGFTAFASAGAGCADSPDSAVVPGLPEAAAWERGSSARSIV